VTFYVQVADVGATLDKVESLGGRRMMGPDSVPDGPTIGLFTDPQGHVIGVVS
jgi:predicted enzyme related to lactoylglutathione lyase